jgi:hypothetical protein
LAARGGGWMRGKGWAKNSSSEIGATAVLTASSNRSNSTSLIALSGVRERIVSKVLCVQIEQIARFLTIARLRPALVNEVLITPSER